MKIVTLCAVILAISASAMAYSTDFEGWTTADLSVSPWGRAGLTTGTIATGNGTNTSSVVQMGYNMWAWLTVPEADQTGYGSLQFDFTMESWYPTPPSTPPVGYPSIYLYMANDDIGKLAVQWFIAQKPGVGGNGFDLYDAYADEVLLTDFATNFGWHTMKIDYNAGAGADGEIDLTLDGTMVITGHPFGQSGGVGEINRICWMNAVGYYPQIDNVSVTVIPEPATMALVALGGLMLRRKN